ncbi:hypothetical protein D9613_001498 [Agrocybe pediades]|uniref:Protein kinase domain-containing protein n=1 Tax=Agrocybe pediades TaxID=84607 RepID=A0A8H4R405_9AGAR|nr:hypothetical protein D9613_001498 [Agrocybe pediades]
MKQRSSKAKKIHGVSKTSKYIVPAKGSNNDPARFRPNFKQYIQHAWARSVEEDTTFLILNCTTSATEIAAEECKKTNLASTKLSADDLEDKEIPKAKRQKTPQRRVMPGHSEEASLLVSPWDRPMLIFQKVAKLLSERNIMLVELDYGIYCSPSPSTFLRIRRPCIPDAELLSKTATEPNFRVKGRYEGHDYGLMTLRESLGSGAIGIVHPASLVLQLASGTDETFETEMVFKMTSTEFQRKQLLNEYFIYTHLSPERLRCLWSMAESHSLRDRFDWDTVQMAKCFTSEEEKTAFRSAPKDIHKARVYHGDIRAPNLLIAPDGGIRIIDFDQAKHHKFGGVTWDDQDREDLAMEHILEGKYIDQETYY